MRASYLLALGLFCAGCTTPPGAEPSLAPRAAEAIDPRLPVVAAPDPAPADPALAGRLAALLGQARAAATEFDSTERQVRALAAAAGPAQSESWVSAQAGLARLERARGPAASAAAEVDALAAERLRVGRSYTAADLAALEQAAAELRAINERQVAALDSISQALAR
jgi:GAF domain-containing protein